MVFLIIMEIKIYRLKLRKIDFFSDYSSKLFINIKHLILNTNTIIQMDSSQSQSSLGDIPTVEDGNIPTIGIVTAGHVANGKTKTVQLITGELTLRSEKEIKDSGKTLKLGFANGKIFKCDRCSPPICYSPGPFTMKEKFCSHCSGKTRLVKVYSVVDNPGHHSLMAMVTSSIGAMDAAILIASYPDTQRDDYIFPAPQTIEHLQVVQMGGIPVIATVLNKVDRCEERSKKLSIKDIRKYVNGLKDVTQKYPDTCDQMIIPMSAIYGINVDVLCQKIAETPDPIRDLESDPVMITTRSFDINKPQKISEKTVLQGGALGGVLLQGTISTNDDIVMYPGYVNKIGTEKVTWKEKVNISTKKKDGDVKTKTKKVERSFEYPKYEYCPIGACVKSIRSGTVTVETAKPGGLFGYQLDIDPSITKGDRGVGVILTTPGNKEVMASSMIMFKISTFFLDKDGNEKSIDFSNGTKVTIHINAVSITGQLYRYKAEKQEGRIFLDYPVVIYPGAKIVISEHQTSIDHQGEKNQDSGKNLAQCVVLESLECNRTQ